DWSSDVCSSDLAFARIARTAYVLRDPRQGGARAAREEVRRARGEPGGAGRGHHQAVQLVSGNRSAVRAAEARSGSLEQAFHRRFATGSGQVWASVPAVSVFQGDRRRLRARRLEVTRM